MIARIVGNIILKNHCKLSKINGQIKIITKWWTLHFGRHLLVFDTLLLAILIKKFTIFTIIIRVNTLQFLACYPLNRSLELLKDTKCLIFRFQGINLEFPWTTPPNVLALIGLKRFECTNSSNSDFLECWWLLKETLFCFPRKQWMHFSDRTPLKPESGFFLAKQLSPFSLMWLRLLCHNSQ